MKTAEVDPFVGIVNAGGSATRMPKNAAPLGGGGVVLKALASVGDQNRRVPLVEHQVNWLLGSRASSVIVSVGPHQEIADHVAKRYRDRDDVLSFRVDSALGTGGDLLRLIRDERVAEYLGSTAIIGNADTVGAFNAPKLINFHRRYGNGLTIALSTLRGAPHEDEYHVGSYHRVNYSGEASYNPVNEQSAMPFTVHRGSSTGVMVADIDFLRSVPWSQEDGPLSLDRDIVGYAIQQGRMTAMIDNIDNYNHAADDDPNRPPVFFMDLGTSERWQRAQESGVLEPYLCYGASSNQI